MKYALRKFWQKNLKISNGKENAKKFRLFSYSFVTALVIFLILLASFSGNPFAAIGDALTNFFNAVNFSGNFDRAITSFVIISLAGIAVAVGYKTGLFNIGVSGQMIMAGAISGLFALNVGSSIPNGLGQIVVVLFSITFAAMFATIAGLLKAFFNIHEVVSTILLNWIAFFFLRLVVQNWVDGSLVINNQYTQSFASSYLLKVNNQNFIPALIILVVTTFAIWFLFAKTTLGQKMMMVGKNRDGALAAGINVKMIGVFSMAISGAIAGLMASIVYFARDAQLRISLVNAIPAEGFNGIAIALLAFNNAIAIIPVAFLFMILQTILTNTTLVDPIFIDLALGLLMMFSAINIIFDKFQITQLVYKRFWPKRYALHKEYRLAREQIDLNYYDQITLATNTLNHQIWQNRTFYFEQLQKAKQNVIAIAKNRQDFKQKMRIERKRIKQESLALKMQKAMVKERTKNFKNKQSLIQREHWKMLAELKQDFSQKVKLLTQKGGVK